MDCGGSLEVSTEETKESFADFCSGRGMVDLKPQGGRWMIAYSILVSSTSS